MAVGCGVCGAMYVVQCVWGGVHWPSANVCEGENVFCECEERVCEGVVCYSMMLCDRWEWGM